MSVMDPNSPHMPLAAFVTSSTTFSDATLTWHCEAFTRPANSTPTRYVPEEVVNDTSTPVSVHLASWSSTPETGTSTDSVVGLSRHVTSGQGSEGGEMVGAVVAAVGAAFAAAAAAGVAGTAGVCDGAAPSAAGGATGMGCEAGTAWAAVSGEALRVPDTHRDWSVRDARGFFGGGVGAAGAGASASCTNASPLLDPPTSLGSDCCCCCCCCCC